MSDWVIFPFNVLPILVGFVTLVLGIYLVRIPDKSRATKALIVFVLANGANSWLASLRNISANSGWSGALLSAPTLEVGVYLTGFLGSMSLLVFAYRLGDIRFRREEWVAYVAFGLLLGAYSVLMVADSPLVTGVGAHTGMILMAWSVLVIARKWRRARRSKEARADIFAALTLLFLAPVFVTAALAALDAMDVPTEVIQPIGEVFIGLFFGIVGLVFLHYGPDPTSLEAKVVVGSLMGVIVLIALISGSFNTFAEIRERYAPPEPQKAFAFVPADSGYVAEGRPVEWPPALGDTLALRDDAFEAIRPPFELIMYGQRFDSLYVGANGIVTFARPPDSTFVWHLLYDFPAPVIAAFNTDLNPEQGGAVTYAADSSGLVVAWRDIVTHEDDNVTGSFRRALNASVAISADGEITVTHGRAAFKPYRTWRYGISPGGPANAVRGLTADSIRARWAAGTSGSLDLLRLPVPIAAGEAMYSERRDIAEMWDWSRWMSFLLLRSGLAAMLVILVVIPLYFRASVKGRMNALLGAFRRVDEGDLAVRVPVRIQDEIGQLSGAFNGMAAALQEYNESMEQLVDERTAELRATQAQLIEQEKLASLGSLTAGIAHEIKNPLNFVNNFAEVNEELADELSEAMASGDAEEAQLLLADLRDNAVQIAKHGKRADSIVRAMMQHARGGESNKESIDVNAFVEEYAALAWHGKRARDHGFQADVVRDLGEDAGTIQAMPQELGRVLVNLLGNAFDALKGRDDGRVHLSTRRLDDYVEIRVADNGPGIPEEIRDRIFEPFFTTKATGEGTGLGLSLSYDIVTKGHGGTMTVGAGPEGGAEFVVRLPA